MKMNFRSWIWICFRYCNGNDFSLWLKCVYTYSFSWTKNGIHFDVEKDPKVTMKPHSGTLVIDISGIERAEDYEGVYQCTARNEHGTAVSNNIVIRQSSTFS